MATKTHQYSQGFFKGGFLKTPMHLMTMPGVDKLMDEKGAAGLGLYVLANLELCNSATHWGSLEGRQISALAQKAHLRKGDVLRIIKDSGLFLVDGERYTSVWMVEQFHMSVTDAPQGCAAPARTYITHVQDVDKDIEKESRENAPVRVSADTHVASAGVGALPVAASADEDGGENNYEQYSCYLKR